MLSCFDVANYFLVLVDRNAGDSITHLKLQKLLYFAQGVSLALKGKPLFKEELKAWNYGPVVPSIYSQFKIFDSNTIPLPAEMDFDIYSQSTKELIFKTYSIYGEHSASYLLQVSHDDHLSWREAYNSLDKTLDTDLIKKDFIKYINNKEFEISEIDIAKIVQAEDEWWMNYDSGEPVEDITEEVNKRIDIFVDDGEKYISALV